MRNVHFIGVGGVGMNGLAQLAVHSGRSVTGSDRACTPELSPFKELSLLGIQFFPQDGTAITSETEAVVFSTAIEEDNPDLEKAKELGIPLLHRAEFLRELADDAQLIAVAGTAGKTTTTGLLGWIFECLDLDPYVYNGAAVLNWKNEQNLGNVRKGLFDFWIIEADESDRSFLQFHPAHSIITNISKDHYELDELYRMFGQFKSQTTGHIVEGAGDELVPGDMPNSFCYKGIEFVVSILGRHNLENAFCAVRLCDELGLCLRAVRDAVAQFKGIERRLEIVGDMGGITVIDDYAHNPSKISAALTTVSDQFSHVHAYWRPHGFTPLYQCKDELIETFSRQQSLFILPVYYAGGTVDKKITSAEFVKQLNAAGVPAEYVEDYTVLLQRLKERAVPGDAILGMGARDPELPLFAKRLVSE